MRAPRRFPILSVILLTAPIAADVPETRTEPVREEIHGETIVDPYRWLEALEDDSEEVRAWTTRQNDYTREILDQFPGREKLEKRMADLMQIGAIGTPRMRLGRYFYSERKGNENQASLYVRESHDGPPRLLLDTNGLDEKGLYSLDWYVPSRDGSRVAFGLSYAGDEMTVLHVLDVDSGEWLADEIPGKTRFGGWSPDGESFLYSRLEDPEDAYSRSVRFHRIGRHFRHDPILLRQTVPSEIPGAFLSENGRWIITEIFKGWSRQDVYAVDVDRWLRTGQFEQVPVAVGFDARFSGEDVLGDTLYLSTTLDAPNGQLFAIPLNRPERENWKPLVAEREKAVLESVQIARGYVVCAYTEDAVSKFERFRLDGSPVGPLELPGLGSANLRTHPERTEAFLSYTSFNESQSIYRVDLATGERSLWARPEIPVDPESIEVKQIHYASKDGTRVPMFVIHRKGLALDGKNPCVLYGYGGFNISLTPSFSATRFPWFEHGGVFAIANLRGGGEYGEAWHRAGMLENKQNVFDDFYAAAETLIREGYTNAGQLACWGGSNGGLLTGAAVTQRPDLFAAAISAVPLLDMLRYHKFLMAKFWVPEYGSSEDPKQFRWLREYSPYHNIEKGRRYPALFFTAGENDNRVHPLHARKMAAAMQALAGNDPEKDPILLWVDRDAGHGAGKPLHLRIRDVADRWAFTMQQTGMDLTK